MTFQKQGQLYRILSKIETFFCIGAAFSAGRFFAPRTAPLRQGTPK